jgi:Mg-chelatase subunit ChlD
MAAVPNEYLCPITMGLMTDPVIGEDGYTYERKSIEEWLQTHTTSPMTRCGMNIQNLKPNFNLRSSIERWKLSNTATTTSAPLQAVEQKSFVISKRQEVKDDLMIIDIETTHKTPQEPILIAVLDTSGSMDERAKQKPSDEGDDFSRLDLIKHSMKTVASLLNKQYNTTTSSLCIIEFSSNAKIVMPITPMDDVGVKLAHSSIDRLRASGGTHIWDGLRLGLDTANTVIKTNPNANVQILLLTDGEPTIDYLPPLGIKKSLNYKLNGLSGRCGISTFGFGYSLDCELLQDICNCGGGSYGFIPDCSMVGTVFINWCAKVLLTLSHHVSIKMPQGEYLVGDLTVGRKHTIVIPNQEVTTVDIIYDNKQIQTIPLVTIQESIQDEYYLHRLKLGIRKIRNQKYFDSIDIQDICALEDSIKAVPNKTELLESILTDIRSDDDGEGQILKATSTNEWYFSWGRNHLIAYYRALELRQCINFKDKVLQVFAGKEFNDLQEQGIEIFSNIDPPKPSVRNYKSYNSSGYTGQNPYAPNPTIPITLFDSSDIRTIDMRSFVNSAGSCFTGDCVCLMEGSRLKFVKNLKKGDVVWGGHKVAALTYTPVNAEIDMVAFDTDLKITPWHPVRDQKTDKWVFPGQIEQVRKLYVTGLYNLVLESGHVVELNGYTVCCLGHGFTDNDVITHKYFGTQAVIEDLKKKDGWNEGYIVLDSKNIVRDEATTLIMSI